VDGEIVVERRRQWMPEAKAALMAEVEAEGGQVLVVAQHTGSRRAFCTIGDRPGRPRVWQRKPERSRRRSSFRLVSSPRHRARAQ
jgi:hypothetical protein